MKKMRKSLFMMLALLLLSLPLASACSKDAPGSAAAKDPGKAQDQAKTADANKAPEPIEFTIFVDFPWFWTDKFEGPIPEEITKRTGVKLKVIKATDDKQLPVMIASGNLPDIIYSDRLSERLANPNVSFAWDELIPKYAPDFKLDPIEIGNSTMDDGHYYTVRNAFATKEQWDSNQYALPSGGTKSLSVRKDILEKLGNPPLKTLDDYVNILGMVKKQFPEMTPLVLGEGGNAYAYFASQLGVQAGSNNAFEQNGQIKHRINDPALLDTYKFMNRLYLNGYFKAEALAYNIDQYRQQVQSGKAFSFNRTTYDADSNSQAMKKAGIPGEYQLVENELSSKSAVINSGVGWAGTYITKNNKNPGRAIQFLKFMKSDEGQRLSVWGLEGEHWTLSKDGYPAFTPQYSTDKKDYTNFIKKYGVGAWTFGMSAITEGLSNFDPSKPNITARLQNVKKITQYRPELSFVLPPDNTDERTIYNKISDLMKNEEPKILLAKSEDEAVRAYQTMLQNAQTIGLAKLEDYMTKRYADVMKKYKK